MSMRATEHVSHSDITNNTTCIILGLLLDANGMDRDSVGKNEKPQKHLKQAVRAALTVYSNRFAGKCHLIVNVYMLRVAVLMFPLKCFRRSGFPKT